MTTQEEVLIRHLIAMIQADGVIAPEETGLLAQVLGSLDLPPDEVAKAGSWLTQPQKVNLDELKAAFNNSAERQAIKSILLELAGADSSIGHDELALLNQLMTALGPLED